MEIYCRYPPHPREDDSCQFYNRSFAAGKPKEKCQTWMNHDKPLQVLFENQKVLLFSNLCHLATISSACQVETRYQTLLAKPGLNTELACEDAKSTLPIDHLRMPLF